LLAAGCSNDESAEQLVEPEPELVDLFAAVDPFIASGGFGFAIGASYPGPALPFAMVHPGPDTRDAANTSSKLFHASGYFYDDPYVGGFSLTRMQGTGVPDYGTFAFMPVDGMNDTRTEESGYAAMFQKDNEQASPGYYKVGLDSGIDVEVTSTLRAAIFRFTFADGVDPVVLADVEHALSGTTSGNRCQLDATGMMDMSTHMDGAMGGRFGGFDAFARAAFDVAPSSSGVWDDTGLHEGDTDASGTDVGCWVRFAPGTRTVQMRVAFSFIDNAGAANNLDAEIPTFAFDDMRAAAEQTWRNALSKIEIYGAGDDEATIVASAAYRAQLMPTLMSDVDGRVRAVGGDIVTTTRPRYSDFSLWDTYRTVHPWLFLSEHMANVDLVESLVAMAREGGAVPQWSLANGDTHSMLGSPGEIVLAEAAAKGFALDEQEAYDLARVAAFGPAPGDMGGRGDGQINDYMKYGYVPSDLHNGAVSETQEFAAADGPLGAWARRLGRTADADLLEPRGQSFAKLYNAESGFFQPKRADGTWDTWGGPLAGQGPYVEGNAWQYLWMAPHDPDSLAETLGGREAALERLREFFQLSFEEEPFVGLRQYFWPGNEPDIHAPWLFAAWGSRSEAARWVRWAFEVGFRTGPAGLDGNDDGGTLSSWVLLAATGLYPVVGSDRYIVAAPLFQRVVLHRPDGDLRIEATRNPHNTSEVQGVLLDGNAVSGPYLTHAALHGQHTLVFRMASP
jgi:predicted alpha-1,2-mannosidase